MKIKSYSIMLATLYVIVGLTVFFALPYYQSLIVTEGIPLTTFSLAVFRVDPSGWLLVMLTLAALVILKDSKFHSRLLNPLFTVVLALLVIGITYAVASLWVPPPIEFLD